MHERLCFLFSLGEKEKFNQSSLLFDTIFNPIMTAM